MRASSNMKGWRGRSCVNSNVKHHGCYCGHGCYGRYGRRFSRCDCYDCYGRYGRYGLIVGRQWSDEAPKSGCNWYRSHFGSRYKLGCCGHAGLFAAWFDSWQTRFARYWREKAKGKARQGQGKARQGKASPEGTMAAQPRTTITTTIPTTTLGGPSYQVSVHGKCRSHLFAF